MKISLIAADTRWWLPGLSVVCSACTASSSTLTICSATSTARGLSALRRTSGGGYTCREAQNWLRATTGERVVQAPLSLAQHSLWKVYEAFGHDEIFNLPFAICFLDPVDETALRQAFIDVMTRRTAYCARCLSTETARYISRWCWRPICWITAGFISPDETPAGNASELLVRAGDHRFDLTTELPLRATFLQGCGHRSAVASRCCSTMSCSTSGR